MAKKKEKIDDIDNAVAALNDKHGANTVIKLGDMEPVDCDVIETGALSLDLAIGVGGIPSGRMIEIFGPESCGKSTLAMNIVKECQKAGGKAVYIDVENALDPEYADAIGVDVDNLLISQPDSAEAAFDVAEKMALTNQIDLVVIDSVAALIPKSEFDREMGKAQMGNHAQLMSQALRRLTSTLKKSKTAIIFINQIRMKIGNVWGNPETTPGGRALAFYASVRIDMRVKEKLKDGEEIIGNRVRCKMVKNKVAPPFKEAYFEIIFGRGIKKFSCIAEAAEMVGIIEKAGSWFKYKGENIAQGKNKLIKKFKAEPAFLAQIEKETRETYAVKKAKRIEEDKKEHEAEEKQEEVITIDDKMEMIE